VVVQLFLVMMAVAGAKEATIAGRAAIRVLKQYMAQEPIFDADSSRTEELFVTAMGTTRGLSLRSGFVHGKILCWGRLCYNGRRPCFAIYLSEALRKFYRPKRCKTQRKTVLHSTDCSLIRERLTGIEHPNRSKTHSNRLTSASG